MKKKISIIVLTSLIIVTLITVGVAWLVEIADILPSSEGSILGGYFASGDGSESSPYEINEPTHVYNLAWLQYMGHFDGAKVNFVLSDNVDMRGIVIPPIGTTKYPFFGYFDGGGFTISNATVSNYMGGTGGISDRPLSVTKINDASIIGFFGVIGEISSAGTTDNVVNQVENLKLENITVRTETSESLIGLLAGYVNGTVKNVAVGGESTMVVAENTKAMKIGALCGLSGDSVTELDDLKALSLFSLVGAAHKDVEWAELPQASGGDGLIGVVPRPGSDEAGFGGSIDMEDLAKRLSYMYAERVVNGKDFPVVFNVNQSSSLSNKKSYLFDYHNMTSAFQVAYLGANTVLALNVDTEKMFAGAPLTLSLTSGNSTINFSSSDYYNNAANTDEIVLNNNTGYIVGGGAAGNAWVRARIQKITGSNGGIKNSLPTGATTITGTDSSDTNLTFYTADIDGINSIIDKNNNSFKQFKTVVDNFVSTSAGDDLISGIRFFSTAANMATPRGINVDENGNLLSGSTKKTVKLYGTGKENYEMVDGAINFTLSGAGYITAIAGTYFSSSADHSLFSLYQVDRNESNEITKVTKINTIHTKTTSDGKTEIHYNLTDTEGYTCVFNTEGMNNLTTESAAYYFEIPVKPGDYALGGAVGETNGAYLMYLDIGSNGDLQLGTGGGEGGEGGDGEETKQVITGVNFVDGTPTADIASHVAEHGLLVYQICDSNNSAAGFTATFAQRGNDGSMTTPTLTSGYTITRFEGSTSAISLASLTVDLPKKKEE